MAHLEAYPRIFKIYEGLLTHVPPLTSFETEPYHFIASMS